MGMDMTYFREKDILFRRGSAIVGGGGLMSMSVSGESKTILLVQR